MDVHRTILFWSWSCDCGSYIFVCLQRERLLNAHQFQDVGHSIVTSDWPSSCWDPLSRGIGERIFRQSEDNPKILAHPRNKLSTSRVTSIKLASSQAADCNDEIPAKSHCGGHTTPGSPQHTIASPLLGEEKLHVLRGEGKLGREIRWFIRLFSGRASVWDFPSPYNISHHTLPSMDSMFPAT